MVILSHLPFQETEKIDFPDHPYPNFSIRLVIQPLQLAKPLTIYALHAIPPVGAAEYKQRNYELKTVAKRIEQDSAENILFAGDWNITPYSPFFADLLSISQLKEQTTSLFPLPTWTTFSVPWLMQIPIDHILSSSSLKLVKKQRENPAFSDHYALIASFTPSFTKQKRR